MTELIPSDVMDEREYAYWEGYRKGLSEALDKQEINSPPFEPLIGGDRASDLLFDLVDAAIQWERNSARIVFLHEYQEILHRVANILAQCPEKAMS